MPAPGSKETRSVSAIRSAGRRDGGLTAPAAWSALSCATGRKPFSFGARRQVFPFAVNCPKIPLHHKQAEPFEETASMAKVFEGLRVIDFTQVIAGPYCSYQL